VTIKVDAYPDYDFNGTVTSFSPATGSRFSPPDNATGNFVKTVQRLPVKLLLMPTTILKNKMRPGMNVDIDVHIKCCFSL
jgi:membrane fusion protein (multidrug efflux system)